MATRTQRKQNPQLKERRLADGRISFFLEYYMGRTQTPRIDNEGNQMFYEAGKMAGKPMFVVKHIRKQEDLKLYCVAKPRTPEEREHKRQIELLAESVRGRREQELLQGEKGFSLNLNKYGNIFDFFTEYHANYTNADKRTILLAINRFKSFIREKHPEQVVKKPAVEIDAINKEWEAKHKGIYGKHDINPNAYYTFFLKPGQVTEILVSDFVAYLKANSEGSGAASAYGRFRKILRRAYKEGVLKNDPCEGVKSPTKQTEIEKDVLSPEEITTLVNTHYKGENPEIRRAFIVSLYCGVRYCDVRDLRYNNIDYSNAVLTFEQSKTKAHSKHSRVTIPLREDVMKVIGKPEDFGRTREDLVFKLPSHTMCNKALGHWAKKAGIQKHITWHCGRHSFATNILTGGANIRVVADLLGHSGLSYVQTYTRAIDAAKVMAVASLPEIVG